MVNIEFMVMLLLHSTFAYRLMGTTNLPFSMSRLRRATLLQSTDERESELATVRNYFNSEGFSRWNKIYSDSDEVNKVQLDIRTGHDQTISKILKWFDDDSNTPGLGVKDKTLCDCGCGVGSLAIPLLERGAIVSASDISSSMVDEAERRTPSHLKTKANFFTSDLESVTGKYDTVCCVDVAIHYPTEQFKDMIGSLCDLSERRLIFSFAPKTWYFTGLKKFGELFPGPSKATRAYLHEEKIVEEELSKRGFKIERREFTGTNFYFSTLFEVSERRVM